MYATHYQFYGGPSDIFGAGDPFRARYTKPLLYVAQLSKATNRRIGRLQMVILVTEADGRMKGTRRVCPARPPTTMTQPNLGHACLVSASRAHTLLIQSASHAK